MSLLIKGMDMPKKCTACPFYYVDFSDGETSCLAIGCEVSIGEHRDKDCPLVEIPTPHDRLISADRLIAVLKNTTTLAQSDYDVFNHILKLIEHQPTIIEAEEKAPN